MEQQTQTGLSDAKKQLLSRYLSGAVRPSRHARSPAGIPRRGSGNIVPQSLNQEQVWTHVQWIGDKPAYNELISIHRHGHLDIHSLERVLDEMNRRHEIWRTTFAMSEGAPPQIVPVQIVHNSAPPVKLPLHDLRTLPHADRVRQSECLAAADARAPFDLNRLPLWRAVLVQIADEEFHLHMNLHQIVLDGVTVYRILLPELIALYTAFSQGRPSPLADPGPQYADFALWQRARLTQYALAPHLGWWKQKLASPLPRLDLPNCKPRPPVQTYNGATEMLFLRADVVNPLRAFAESESATLFMALAAGFFTLLHRYTGQTDLILGIPASGRSPETEGIMGYFLNLLPVRVDLSGNPGFREVLQRVRREIVDALEHGSVPLLRLLREVRPPMDPSRNPLFQIMISLEPPMPPLDRAWDLTQSAASSGSTKMDMYLNLDTRPDGLMAPILYNPDIFDVPAVRRMFADWSSILEGGIANPQLPVSKLGLAVLPDPTPLKPKPPGRLFAWLTRGKLRT